MTALVPVVVAIFNAVAAVVPDVVAFFKQVTSHPDLTPAGKAAIDAMKADVKADVAAVQALQPLPEPTQT